VRPLFRIAVVSALYTIALFIVFFGVFFRTMDGLAVEFLSEYWSEKLIWQTLTGSAPVFAVVSLVFGVLFFACLYFFSGKGKSDGEADQA